MSNKEKKFEKQRTRSKEEKKVKFPQEIVFDEMVKDGDSAEIVNFLRRKSVDVDINKRNDDGSTPLKDLIITGNLKCVRVLVGLGADVNKMDERGQTPLHYACQTGSLLMVKLLLNSNADPSLVDHSGLFPVDYTDDFELIELLVSYSSLANGCNTTSKKADCASNSNS